MEFAFLCGQNELYNAKGELGRCSILLLHMAGLGKYLARIFECYWLFYISCLVRTIESA